MQLQVRDSEELKTQMLHNVRYLAGEFGLKLIVETSHVKEANFMCNSRGVMVRIDCMTTEEVGEANAQCLIRANSS